MKKYAAILILSTLTMYANPPPLDIPSPDSEAPPITTSPAYVPQKCPEKKTLSTKWKMTTIMATTVTGIVLGLAITGKNKGKSAPSQTP